MPSVRNNNFKIERRFIYNSDTQRRDQKKSIRGKNKVCAQQHQNEIQQKRKTLRIIKGEMYTSGSRKSLR